MSKNMLISLISVVRMWSFTQVHWKTQGANVSGYDWIFNRNYRIN